MLLIGDARIVIHFNTQSDLAKSLVYAAKYIRCGNGTRGREPRFVALECAHVRKKQNRGQGNDGTIFSRVRLSIDQKWEINCA
jgi:hypothetical protein